MTQRGEEPIRGHGSISRELISQEKPFATLWSIALRPPGCRVVAPTTRFSRCPEAYKLPPSRRAGKPAWHGTDAKGRGSTSNENPLFQRLQARRAEGRQQCRRCHRNRAGHPAYRPGRSDQWADRAVFQLAPEARAGGGEG